MEEKEIRPRLGPAATALAANATDVLERATLHATLDELDGDDSSLGFEYTEILGDDESGIFGALAMMSIARWSIASASPTYPLVVRTYASESSNSSPCWSS